MQLARLLALTITLSCLALRPINANQQAPIATDSNLAPSERFAFHGHVVDTTGASIIGARVIAMSDDGREQGQSLTDQRGNFTLLLTPGGYAIRVSASGFDEVSQHIVIAGAGSPPPEFVLPVAGIGESLTVTAPTARRETIASATKTPTLLRDVPQSVTVITKQLITDQLMTSIGDVVRYVPGITTHQGENNRDQIIVRGTNSSADFFLNGVRDDVQYYRDLYNLDRVEALKGPNAMIFGRGGGGGVLNRVTKEALFAPAREMTLQGGSFGHKRFTTDLDQPLGATAAFRVNGMYENSGSFRDWVTLERYGVNPTLTLLPGARTKITFSYEHAHDRRVADRGVPSFRGKPADVDPSSYFGNPRDTYVRANVNLAYATIEHRTRALMIRNNALVGDYDRGYQNFVPGAVSTDKTQVALTAYNNSTERLNVFNQTDFIYVAATGPIRHTVLFGAEAGRQASNNFRNTGFFNNAATAIFVPYGSPTISVPVTFRQSATDADNHLRTIVLASYVQDQVEVSRAVHLIAGVRFDRFDLDYVNNRTRDDLRRIDRLVSPRAGIVVKPIVPLSLYGSYTVSHLPSSGDQFSSLTTITQQVKPEHFANYEMGAKWDIQPSLSLTTAVYRLNRTNTRSTDPNDATRIVQTGAQRTNGYELSVDGNLTPGWRVTGAYAYQHAFVTSATTAAATGAEVAQVPRHTFSFWNRYQAFAKVAFGLGVVSRTDMYAAIDNTVTLPGYMDVDAAVYVSVTKRMLIQANVENALDRKFYVNADNNTNISPGAPRSVRVALMTRF